MQIDRHSEQSFLPLRFHFELDRKKKISKFRLSRKKSLKKCHLALKTFENFVKKMSLFLLWKVFRKICGNFLKKFSLIFFLKNEIFSQWFFKHRSIDTRCWHDWTWSMAAVVFALQMFVLILFFSLVLTGYCSSKLSTWPGVPRVHINHDGQTYKNLIKIRSNFRFHFFIIRCSTLVS